VSVSRQALARTNATEKTIGPHANTLIEPTVTFLRVSDDGQWLASVDEWSSPTADLEQHALGSDQLGEAQAQRREVHLKFWRRNEERAEWELVTRIDRPHTAGHHAPSVGRLLDLVADPVRAGFVTVGNDGTVRMWKPRHRIRGNLVMKARSNGKSSEPLWAWKCRYTIALDSAVPRGTLLSQAAHFNARDASARVAYSADGSLLAVAYQLVDGGVGGIDFIDAARGTIRCSKPGLFTGKIFALGFIQQYLVIISRQLVIWDTVQDKLKYSISLRSNGLSDREIAATTHLAIDHENRMFAVAVPRVSGGDSQETETTEDHSETAALTPSLVVLFDPTSSKPVHQVIIPSVVTALIHIPGTRDYLTIDSDAHMRRLSPQLSSRSLTAILPSRPAADGTIRDESTIEPVELANESPSSEDEEDVATATAIVSGGGLDEDLADDVDVPVVRPQQLAEVFNQGPAYSMPSVGHLFDQVAGLFAPKTIARRQVEAV
jgi:NET1-associated nuclear protein 1 (U3 small nucleolar RNA-associated protein 17)